jgi:hypothetical protein
MMKRVIGLVAFAMTLIIGVWVRPSSAQVDVHIGINVPPPPVVAFPAPPPVVVVPNTHVYYVPDVTDYDMYHVGHYWYVNRDGYWYRSRAYGGPFAFVEYEHVPHELIVVPVEYGKHPKYPKDYEHWKKHHDKHKKHKDKHHDDW